MKTGSQNTQRILLDSVWKKFGRDDVDNLVAEGKFEITQKLGRQKT